MNVWKKFLPDVLKYGRPNLRLKFTENLSVGLGAFPSLYIRQNKTEPKLGLSPRLDYKRWVLIAPVYHFDSPDRWIWTFGGGIKFH